SPSPTCACPSSSTCRPARSRRRCPSDSVAFHTKRHGANAERVSKADQIAYIERSRTKFPNRRAGNVEFKETVTAMQEHKNWATVAGSAWFKRKGEIVSQCEFFEFWLIVEGRWQVASLCIEDTDRTEET
ncbi:hypothetical protein, partial [Ralstonia mannitolilytica]|uniref:hypothetical protein n=1 Tax=Ralstonia mannitolilytica TaxID=105219 RepID=UPI00292FFACB